MRNVNNNYSKIRYEINLFFIDFLIFGLFVDKFIKPLFTKNTNEEKLCRKLKKIIAETTKAFIRISHSSSPMPSVHPASIC